MTSEDGGKIRLRLTRTDVNSPRAARPLFPTSIWTTLSSVTGAGAVFISVIAQNLQGTDLLIGSVTAGLLGGTSAVTGYFSVHERQAREAQPRDRVLAAEQELEEALRRPSVARTRDNEEASGDAAPATAPDDGVHTGLGLPELWKVTHSRLDHYHETVLGQARRSFRSAQGAMWLGFLLLAGFAFMALKATSTAGAVVAGGLGAVSAGLAGYVSRTFVKSQETAAGHLRAYFDQPLALSRYLAAERLLRDSGMGAEKRAEVLAALVLAVVAPSTTSGAERKEAAGEK
ncbi:hypothetical protein [Streptomyces hokutonensis]|uniref:hypothetical protein n=1 Tax=Streptomyces hokutonensis TaxID=1306990 RepID=UPI003691EC41